MESCPTGVIGNYVHLLIDNVCNKDVYLCTVIIVLMILLKWGKAIKLL